jgi:DNA modification methylase
MDQNCVTVLSNEVLLKIEDLPIRHLKRNARNPRTHSEKQIAMLSRSIDSFGFLVPCLVDEKNRLLSGHARVAAADRLGMTKVPCIRIRHLTDLEKRALIIADNKLAELAEWDRDALRTELQFFTDLKLDFDFSVIGFETPEIDTLLESGDANRNDDALPVIVPEQPVVSRLGDLWCAGPHRIYCGDGLAAHSYELLLGGERARLVFTDPPYNVPIMGHVGGRGRIHHREFAMASGEMAADQFTSFLATAMKHWASYSTDGSLHFVSMDWRHCHEILTAGYSIYAELKNICVWRKSNAGLGSLYRSQHEFVFVFKNGTAPHTNNVNLGVHGRNRSNVWDYGGLNSFGRQRDALLATHPTVKPVALVADVIKDASARGDLVLDPMSGSGTTVIAAERTGRRAAVMEIDPIYIDAIVRRWQAFSGKDAVCASTGATFTERETAAHADHDDTRGLTATDKELRQ